MDFENLIKVINKPVMKWTCQDVSKWLSFIGLQTFVNSFKKCGIDGSILQDLQIDDLEEQLNIKSNITKKKIMHWIKNGLKQYSKYLSNNKENIDKSNISMTMEIQAQDNKKKLNSNPIKIQKTKQLIIIPQQGIQSSMFCISQEGGKIGRHSSNNILVIQQSVSRYHAQIKYDKIKQQFLLYDLKSSTGTFLKIQQKLILKKGIIFEVGSYQFLIQQINSNTEGSELVLKIVEGNSSKKQLRLFAKTSVNQTFKIGRKQTNQIYYEDSHLSGVHAIITYMNGKFVIEDMKSTNGTWLKLGQQPKQLDDYSSFRIGSVCVYKCQYNLQKKIVESMRNENCIVCYQNDRDALYLPCKHNLVCLKCSKNIKECPACRQKLCDIIKIYK